MLYVIEQIYTISHTRFCRLFCNSVKREIWCEGATPVWFNWSCV